MTYEEAQRLAKAMTDGLVWPAVFERVVAELNKAFPMFKWGFVEMEWLVTVQKRAAVTVCITVTDMEIVASKLPPAQLWLKKMRDAGIRLGPLSAEPTLEELQAALLHFWTLDQNRIDRRYTLTQTWYEDA